MVQSETELRARYERPGSLQRTSLSIISDTDRGEAAGAGAEAVRRALAGESDVMVAIQRQPGPEYRVRYGAAPLAAIAHAERLLPDALIDPSGVDVTDAFLAYAQPLIGGPLPPALRFT
jgi:6-phosphofructokinase 1